MDLWMPKSEKRVQPPFKTEPKKPPQAKHPMALPGMRWLPSLAMSPANLLQLQQSAGNQAVKELLKRYAGHPSPLKTYRAARKDSVTPVHGEDSEHIMKSQDPHYGDWHIQFVSHPQDGTVLYWVTLERYKNRQRHMLFDPSTLNPLFMTGSDLDERERKWLTDWAGQMLTEHLTGKLPKLEPPQQQPPAGSMEEEEEDFLSALLDDGGDEEGNGGLGMGALATAALAAANDKNAKKGKAPRPGGGTSKNAPPPSGKL